MSLQIQIIGVLLMLLALIHIGFPKYFKWKLELKSLSLINSQMMTTHTFFIALTVFLMGLLCVTSSTELIETTLGKKISLGLGIFWLIRLFFQMFVYSSLLWKGKKFETTMHILFTLFWVYMSSLFLIIYFK
ncbi:hypothetical protein LPB03_15640 [Polaribacter vadi]|uniref:Uncharacterized protein n=1 Tax=Polaribacter vadi TaxID=1774273 RepID=A0A1B8TQB9_9FLAO|nr:hypothetical protein [Polaribacter vadi]AOW18797.1 hypothetical protein LPB03_15640 [Polaribacter vadi]OBY61839.1 hypothetical protein LPB3_13665 [Polaribacter vadi]